MFVFWFDFFKKMSLVHVHNTFSYTILNQNLKKMCRQMQKEESRHGPMCPNKGTHWAILHRQTGMVLYRYVRVSFSLETKKKQLKNKENPENFFSFLIYTLVVVAIRVSFLYSLYNIKYILIFCVMLFELINIKLCCWFYDEQFLLTWFCFWF